jgi:hypothetical protein
MYIYTYICMYIAILGSFIRLLHAIAHVATGSHSAPVGCKIHVFPTPHEVFEKTCPFSSLQFQSCTGWWPFFLQFARSVLWLDNTIIPLAGHIMLYQIYQSRLGFPWDSHGFMTKMGNRIQLDHDTGLMRCKVPKPRASH